KYAEALRLKPDFHAAFGNWGAALSEHAKTKTGDEADRLFEEAGGKYAEALRLKPDYHEALSNWGTALLEHAKTKTREQADGLLRDARKRLLEAERISPGSGAYNLACVEAREGKMWQAVQWLQAAQMAGQRLSRAKIESDNDFDRVRNHAEFVKFVESLTDN
ncbi:MAG: TPR end-of-group domain-containing protein, partial [Bryobacteraceae bacterium]